MPASEDAGLPFFNTLKHVEILVSREEKISPKKKIAREELQKQKGTIALLMWGYVDLTCNRPDGGCGMKMDKLLKKLRETRQVWADYLATAGRVWVRKLLLEIVSALSTKEVLRYVPASDSVYQSRRFPHVSHEDFVLA